MTTHSLVNMNNHVLCAVDLETTGTIPGWYEIIQFSCIPLNSDIEPVKDMPLFDMKVRPEHLDRIDWEVCNVTKREMQDICNTGHSLIKVMELFEYYFNSLDLGDKRKLIPLGHNHPFDRSFLQIAMGVQHYEHFFHGFFRDTMGICIFMNDRADVHCEKVPFPKVNLKYVANQLQVEYLDDRSHDSLYDCYITAKIYKKLLWELIAQ